MFIIQNYQVEDYRSMSVSDLQQYQQTQIAGFVAKTFEILKNQEYSKIIFWGPSGKDFIIKDINKFQEIVLPKYFRHKKINSFIRQLNMYGFHKSRKDNAKSIFSHPNFLKDHQDLLVTIKRKVKCPQPILKTPTKEKSHEQDPRNQETATKQPELQRRVIQDHTPIILRDFLESRECLNSRFNLNFSLKKVSMNELPELNQNDNEDQLSIEFAIDNRQDDFQPLKIINPSFFLGSFNQKH